MTIKKPLTSRAYQEIYTSITNGEVGPNDIVTEGMLIKKYGMSKSPIREALVSLCSEKILQSIPRKGYMVLQIPPKEVLEMVETRLLLELTLLQKSIRSMTEEKLQILSDYVNKTEKPVLEEKNFSPQKAWNSNIGFHLMLASYGENDYMYGVLEGTLKRYTRAATQYLINARKRNGSEGSAKYHTLLLEALKAMDAKKAESLLKTDIELTLKQFFPSYDVIKNRKNDAAEFEQMKSATKL